jgi:prepilin-type processing-associated H-X9-DG protein
MLCSWCHKRNLEGSDRCQYCGRAILLAAPPTSAAGQAAHGPARSSGMATASVVLGALGLFTAGLTALVGLILGIVGLRQIDGSGGAVRGRSTAIAGIVVSGLVMTMMLFLLPIFAAILFPVFAQAREKARATVCISHLKQVGMATLMYAQDNDERLPPAGTWCDAVMPYVRPKEGETPQSSFVCPTMGMQTSGQAYNAWLSTVPLLRVEDPQTTIAAFDARGGWNGAGGPELADARHNQGLYGLFVDGSVRYLRSFEGVRWKPAPPAAPPARSQRRRGRRSRR